MGTFLLFLFIIFLIFFLFGLNLTRKIERLFMRNPSNSAFDRNKRYSNNHNKNNQSNKRSQHNTQHAHQKVFTKDEGEYVDYEEIK